MCGKDNDFSLYAQEKRRNVDSALILHFVCLELMEL